MQEKTRDLIIIGSGVMGLCTAYYASQFSSDIVLLEKATVGKENKEAASFSYTRSVRNDYLDPFYARLAYEARTLWLEMQREAESPLIIECGCLNLAKTEITPDLTSTYAQESYDVLQQLHLKTEAFDQDSLRVRFPQFVADLARLDVEAGFMDVQQVTQTLLATLRARGVRIIEQCHIKAITPDDTNVLITTNGETYAGRQVVITAGWGTNDILDRIEGCALRFPLTPDRPSQSKYFIPPMHKQAQFTPDVLPVFAYLDVGIYGHPLYPGKTPGVKIGIYNPPDVKTLNTHIQDVASFVRLCMPSLVDAEVVDVTDVDQCYYDLVEDDNFILGTLPGYNNIHVGVGWRGTGYKYAPWVGRTLMQLALQDGTVYDISRFNPQRFAHT
jgi:N-methyl-L-tryptophan oxidase